MPLKTEDMILAAVEASRKETADLFKVQREQLFVLERMQSSMAQKCEDECKVVSNLSSTVWGDMEGNSKGLQRDMDEVKGWVTALDNKVTRLNGKWTKAIWLIVTAVFAFLARMAHSLFQGPPN